MKTKQQTNKNGKSSEYDSIVRRTDTNSSHFFNENLKSHSYLLIYKYGVSKDISLKV